MPGIRDSFSNSPTQSALEPALASITDTVTSASYIYICEAAPGSATSAAVWRCSRLTVATGVLAWADGDGNFDNIADNRASLTYS